MYRKTSKRNSKKLLVVVLVLLLLGAIATAYFLPKDKEADTPAGITTVNQVNYDPPTENEQQAGDRQKEEIIENETPDETLPDEADVVIVDASQYGAEIEVRAFVANMVKDGQCLIAFTNGENRIEKTVPANADASTTPCITLTIPRGEFATAGTWDVTVTYTNESAQGSAQGIITIE